MTIKTDDITLLPCPCCGAPAVTGKDAEYENTDGEPAVEADRQGRVPSDDELLQLASECCDSTDASGEEPKFTTDESILCFARALLSRYGSSQPAAEAVLRKILQVVQRYLPPDGPSAEDAMGQIIALVDPWPLSGQPAASAEVAHGLLQQFFGALDDALSKERASPWTGLKGEKFRDRMLAWDRVKKLRGQLLAAPVAQEPATTVEPVAYLDIGANDYLDLGSHRDEDWLMRLPPGRHMLGIIGTYGEDGKYRAAPVAQEPVAYLACNPETGEPEWGEDCVCKDNIYNLEDTGTIGRPVFFAPVAAPVAQEPPQVTDAEIEQIVTGAGARWDGSVWKVEDADLHPMARALLYRYTTAPVAAQLHVTDEMVTRFLGWHLPQDFAPDAGIAFNPSPDPHSWPVGTNLFTDPQARAMLEYVLRGAPAAAQAHPSAQDREDAQRWKWLKTEAKGHDFDNLSIRLPEQMDAYADAARAAKEKS